MLKLSHVRKDYPGFALDCSFEVKSGQITGLIGPNGAGKTTIYKAVLGLIHTDGGYIELFGKDVADITPGDRRNIGVVLAESGFSGYLYANDVCRIMKSFYPEFDENFFRTECEQAGLAGKKKIKEFSTGMKVKLKLIAAMSHNAQFLILDEPTAGLDVIARDEILDMLRDYISKDERRSILISSHISSDLEGLCDDIYLIDKGRIVFHEDTDKILSDYALLKMSAEDFDSVEKNHLLKFRKESFGYACLTDSKAFYAENYPSMVVENGSIDELISMMIRGESI